MAKAFINDTNLTDIADAIRATLDESRQYLPSEMAAAIQSIPIMAQLNRKKYFRPVPAGAASGYATIEQIEGNTVKFNQLSPFTTSRWSIRNAGGTAVFDAEGYLTLTNLSSSTTGNCVGISNPFTPNHICYIQLDYVVGNLDTLNRALNVGWSDSPFYYTGHINVITALNGSALSGSLSAISTVHATWNYFVIMPRAITNTTTLKYRVNIYDLTLIFGAGNEPTTVADFEAWMAQNIGTLPYYDYNAGELLSVKMSGMQTEDSSQQTLDTIALDVTTITGINTATNVRETIFPNGMKQADRAGTSKDVLDLLRDKATVKVGSRAYQAGDESDTDVITDGTTTYYALTTPIEYTDLQDGNGNPINPRYKVEQGGTEQVLPANTSTPTTVAPTLSTIYKKNI